MPVGWGDTRRRLSRVRDVIEPTGQRIDGTPWDEARPPHLPDRLTRISPWVVPFAVAALVHVWVVSREWAGLGPLADVDNVVAVAGARIPAIAASLFGAALFLRHPDARRTAPLLAFGLTLFVVQGLLAIVADPITRFLDGIAGTTDQGFPISPAVTAWSVFTTLVSVFAVLYTAAGLSTARRQPVASAARPLAVVLTSLAIVTVVLSFATIRWADFAVSPWSLTTLAIGVVLALASTLAWSYLLVVTLSGWIAGESPRLGWALATVAAVMFVGIRVVIALPLGLDLASDAGQATIAAIGHASTISWIVLLAAFVAGLPAMDDRPASTPTGSAAG